MLPPFLFDDEPVTNFTYAQTFMAFTSIKSQDDYRISCTKHHDQAKSNFQVMIKDSCQNLQHQQAHEQIMNKLPDIQPMSGFSIVLLLPLTERQKRKGKSTVSVFMLSASLPTIPSVYRSVSFT